MRYAHLVEYVNTRNVIIDANSTLPGAQQIHHIGDGGGRPAAALVEELVERLGGERQSVCRGRGAIHFSEKKKYSSNNLTQTMSYK